VNGEYPPCGIERPVFDGEGGHTDIERPANPGAVSMTLATSTGPHPVNGSASGEFERLARLATLVLNEHIDDAGLCAACRGVAFPCQFAVLAEHNTALVS